MDDRNRILKWNADHLRGLRWQVITSFCKEVPRNVWANSLTVVSHSRSYWLVVGHPLSEFQKLATPPPSLIHWWRWVGSYDIIGSCCLLSILSIIKLNQRTIVYLFATNPGHLQWETTERVVEYKPLHAIRKDPAIHGGGMFEGACGTYTWLDEGWLCMGKHCDDFPTGTGFRFNWVMGWKLSMSSIGSPSASQQQGNQSCATSC